MASSDYTTLTWEEFLSAAEEFVKIAHTLGDNWEFVRKSNDPGYAYLVFKQKISFEQNSLQRNVAETELEELVQLVEVQDNSSAVVVKELLTVEYHVVYSLAYQVPMLYLRAHKSDGSLVRLEEAWKLFEIEGAYKREVMLGILTPMEHPILFSPFLALHPCRTAMLLQQAGQSKNHILTYVSLMGPFVKLQLSNTYGKAFE